MIAPDRGARCSRSATLKYADAKNQRLLEASVTLDSDLQRAEAELIRAKAQVEIAEVDLMEVEAQFTSARKLASLSITVSEIRSRHDE
jgi:hypothetical protein